MNETVHRAWPAVLTGVVALLYAWIGLAAHGWDRVLGVTGAVLILAAIGVVLRGGRRPVRLALVLLGAGALPLAVATWWSVVSPVLALVALLLGGLAVRTLGRRNHPLPAP